MVQIMKLSDKATVREIVSAYSVVLEVSNVTASSRRCPAQTSKWHVCSITDTHVSNATIRFSEIKFRSGEKQV